MNFYDKIHELTRCLKETNEYKEYISLKNSLKEDEKAYNLIKEFKNKQNELQLNYLNGNISQIGIARELGLHPSSIQGWIRKYKAFGPEGLKTIKKNTHYSSELKLSAVKDYINGKGSLADISLKYNLSCTGILTQWINKYNKCHKTCKSHNNKGDHIMTNGRKTTYEERIEIVAFCIANANDYNLTANKYNR